MENTLKKFFFGVIGLGTLLIAIGLIEISNELKPISRKERLNFWCQNIVFNSGDKDTRRFKRISKKIYKYFEITRNDRKVIKDLNDIKKVCIIYLRKPLSD
tara:strand:- start:261 stop:563 length:303 start_codon:yes stop_codon:yes gene_type:complete